MNKKFPYILSGINLKFDTKVISKAKKLDMIVFSYDRKKEPKKIKNKENSSIAWGVSNIIKKEPPDLIYHNGDIGKESMILIFGINPDDVIKKVSKLSLNY
jgi:hydroxymethylpyrimidine/phosphomethylpyrimidine kinase